MKRHTLTFFPCSPRFLIATHARAPCLYRNLPPCRLLRTVDTVWPWLQHTSGTPTFYKNISFEQEPVFDSHTHIPHKDIPMVLDHAQEHHPCAFSWYFFLGVWMWCGRTKTFYGKKKSIFDFFIFFFSEQPVSQTTWSMTWSHTCAFFVHTLLPKAPNCFVTCERTREKSRTLVPCARMLRRQNPIWPCTCGPILASSHMDVRNVPLLRLTKDTWLCTCGRTQAKSRMHAAFVPLPRRQSQTWLCTCERTRARCREANLSPDHAREEDALGIKKTSLFFVFEKQQINSHFFFPFATCQHWWTSFL